MYKIPVSLGTSLGMKLQRTYSYWNRLEKHGIKREDLKRLDLSFEELFMLYLALKYPKKNQEVIQYIKKRISHLHLQRNETHK